MFHLVTSLRIKYLESLSSLNTTLLTYIKIILFLIFLIVSDVGFIYLFYQKMYKQGINYYVFFLTGYAVIFVTVIANFIRFSLFLYNLYNNHPWSNRGEFIFYLEIFQDLLQSIIYLFFFIVVLRKYGLPIYIMRELYVTGYRMYKRFKDLVQYRKISHNFDERFPNATQEELNLANSDCAICLQEMKHPNAKKLICGHLFHTHCLRDWLTRNIICPVCRQVLNKRRRNTPNLNDILGGQNQFQVFQRLMQNRNLNFNPLRGENNNGNSESVREGEKELKTRSNEETKKKGKKISDTEMATFVKQYFEHVHMTNQIYYSMFQQMFENST